MIVNGIRPRTLRRRLLLVGLGALLAAGVISMPAAKADPLSNTEAAYVIAYHKPVCDTIAKFPSEAGLVGILGAIIDDGFTAVGAANIVNSSVANYCPQWWPLLKAVGDKARGQQSISDVVAA